MLEIPSLERIESWPDLELASGQVWNIVVSGFQLTDSS